MVIHPLDIQSVPLSWTQADGSSAPETPSNFLKLFRDAPTRHKPFTSWRLLSLDIHRQSRSDSRER